MPAKTLGTVFYWMRGSTHYRRVLSVRLCIFPIKPTLSVILIASEMPILRARTRGLETEPTILSPFTKECRVTVTQIIFSLIMI